MTIGYGSTVSAEILAMEEDMYSSSDIRAQANRARELATAFCAGQNSDGDRLNTAISDEDTELITQILAGALSRTDAAGLQTMKHHLQQIVRLSNPSARPATIGYQGTTPSWGETTMYGYTEF